MRSSFRMAWGLGFIASLLTAPVSAQDTDVRGARIELVPKQTAVAVVTLENRRRIPMVAWTVGLFEPGASAPAISAQADFTATDHVWAEGSGPIRPGEKRRLEVPLDDREVPTASLRFAVFADGVYEGDPSLFERWQSSRAARAAERLYWIRAVDAVPRASALDARRYLQAQLVERVPQPAPDDEMLREEVRRILRHEGTDAELANAILRLRERAVRENASFTMPVTPAPASSAPDALASVALERGTLTTYFAAVQNLRSRPIEALAFEYREPDRSGGGLSTDYCASEASSPRDGHGRIQPGETREFRLGRPPSSGVPPDLRIRFVMFDDLTFEGSASGRDEVLRTREMRAADIAYARELTAQLLKLPPGETIPFLTARRAERASQLQTQGRRPDVTMIDRMIHEATRRPDDFRAQAASSQDRLDREREALLRHLKPLP
jgi:hypothetical protein